MFKVKSDNFDPSKPLPVSFEFTLTLGEQINSIEKELSPDDDQQDREEMSDTLFIKFKSKKEVTEEL